MPKLSKRLTQLLIIGTVTGSVFGMKWTKQCGHYVPVIIWRKDVYKEGP